MEEAGRTRREKDIARIRRAREQNRDRTLVGETREVS